MARNDNTQALTMLHSALLDTRKELQASVTSGFERLQTSSSSGLASLQDSVTVELGRMRGDLRDTRNRLTQNGNDLSVEVKEVLAFLRDELEQLHAALREHPVPQAVSLPTAGDAGRLELTSASVEQGSLDGTAEEAGTTRGAASSDDGVAGSLSMVPGQRLALEAPVLAPRGASGTVEERLFAERIADTVMRMLKSELTPLYDGLEELREGLARPNGSATAAAPSEFEEAERQDSAVAGLGEQIGAVRQELAALSAHLDSLSVPAKSEPELAAVRADIAELATRLKATAQAEPEVPVTEQHRELLTRAARISSARLVCHRDTLDWLTSQAGPHTHFRLPPEITDVGDGRIAADISGRSLIAVLITLHTTSHSASESDGDWALATTCYHRIATSLSSLSAGGHRITIVLDDGTTETATPLPSTDTTDTAATSAPTSAQPDDGPENNDAHDPGNNTARQ
ncbi:hypothetical protein ACTWP5_30155 [Streptomyces sp. 4N509B]|uniref:hypothetical protein n=1 Tax=Streptomyces sp. 4N509B TaxID=3457413 RepID=UPI003FD2F6FC